MKQSRRDQLKIVFGTMAAGFSLIAFQNFSSQKNKSAETEIGQHRPLKCLTESCFSADKLTDEKGNIVGYIGQKFKLLNKVGETDQSHTMGSIMNAVDPAMENENIPVIKIHNLGIADNLSAKSELADDN
jgi:hypothetical protein